MNSFYNGYPKLINSTHHTIQGEGMNWKPIETAPKTGEYILCYHVIHKVPIAVRYIGKGDVDFIKEPAWLEKTLIQYWPDRAFSHWDDLPEPPE